MIKNRNFSHGKLSEFAPKLGDTIEDCNFTQMQPDTEISTVKNLVFINCNLCNCRIPTGATTEGCNNMQISRCGHLNDGYTCEIECKHMVSKEEIKVDGVLVDTIYGYEDKVVG